MKRIYIRVIVLMIGISPCIVSGQNNLLSNGGFEGHLPSGDYPRYLESFDDRNPPSWLPFNHDVDVRWFIDSIWTPLNQNQIDPNFLNGHFKTGEFNTVAPYDRGGLGDTLFLQPAHGGQFYAGFDAKSDGISRQGLQAKVSTCGLNSGNYRANLFWSRAYQEILDAKIYLSLSDQMDSRKHIFEELDIPYSTYTAGQWNFHTVGFQIDLNDQDHRDNDWFSITGQRLGNSDPSHYIYIDDVRLFRPCDVTMRCAKTHGQICPSVAIQQWPNHP